MEKLHQLALSCYQIDDYLNYHHKAFSQQLLEGDTEIYCKRLGRVPGDQSKRGRNNNMSKGVKPMMMILIVKADLELMRAH